MELSGAEILIQSLINYNVDTVFGYPGSCVMQILDKLYGNKKIRHILVRHEQGAVHAACGYSRVSEKPGVVLVTSGPGATNTVTGIADAYTSGIPLVVVTGQVSSHLLGTDAFQEADMMSIIAPVTKWCFQVRKANQMAEAVAKAFRIAASGLPGPVLLDITKDAQTDLAEYIPDITPSNSNYSSVQTPEIQDKPEQESCYKDVLNILQQSGKDILLVTDNVSHTICADEYFCYNKVLKSGIFNVPGFGLPAAIGATYAKTDKIVCLMTGNLEFQATIKELGVIQQEGLNIKMILFNSPVDNRLGMMAPDYIQLASAYGIKGNRVKKKDSMGKHLQNMLSYEGSYLLEIKD